MRQELIRQTQEMAATATAALDTILALRNPEIVSSKPRTHILCTGDTVRNILRTVFFRRALPPTGPHWRLRQLPTGHDWMITMPRELADLLLEIASLPI